MMTSKLPAPPSLHPPQLECSWCFHMRVLALWEEGGKSENPWPHWTWSHLQENRVFLELKVQAQHREPSSWVVLVFTQEIERGWSLSSTSPKVYVYRFMLMGPGEKFFEKNMLFLITPLSVEEGLMTMAVPPALGTPSFPGPSTYLCTPLAQLNAQESSSFALHSTIF